MNTRWCQPCQINSFRKNFTNWTSGNEKIDDFIQEMQLKINDLNNIVFEWIPLYDQFSNIKEIRRDELTTVCSAKWSPLYLNKNNNKYLRGSDKKVALKYSYNLHKIEFLNEV